MARATWAQRPLRGSLWVLKYPYCHQMMTQTHPRGDRRGSEKKSRTSKNFHLIQRENGQVLTASAGGQPGEFGPGTPATGQGCMVQEKKSSGPRSESTHRGHNTQRKFDPTHPTPIPPHPKYGVPSYGGGSKSKKSLGDQFVSQNDEFTRG